MRTGEALGEWPRRPQLAAGAEHTGHASPISPGEVDRLFQPFQRLGTERTGHDGGHGLGLAIVGAIASAHGADLAAHARPEGGLAIEVSFPAAPKDIEAERAS